MLLSAINISHNYFIKQSPIEMLLSILRNAYTLFSQYSDLLAYTFLNFDDTSVIPPNSVLSVRIIIIQSHHQGTLYTYQSFSTTFYASAET